MDPNLIPQDDIDDVLEMTADLEDAFADILKGNELDLALSALVTAFINSVVAQCDTIDEVMFYRNAFVRLFDASIREIQINRMRRPFS